MVICAHRFSETYGPLRSGVASAPVILKRGDWRVRTEACTPAARRKARNQESAPTMVVVSERVVRSASASAAARRVHCNLPPDNIGPKILNSPKYQSGRLSRGCFRTTISRMLNYPHLAGDTVACGSPHICCMCSVLVALCIISISREEPAWSKVRSSNVQQ